jgi:divalent metal cation (Fe/Co/Zn/Cd) transporter
MGLLNTVLFMRKHIVSVILVIFAGTAFWYGFGPFLQAIVFARAGLVHVPALLLGATYVWAGGMFALAAGTTLRVPPTLPDPQVILVWTGLIFSIVLALVLSRRREVEERLDPSVRRQLGNKYIAIGAILAIGLFIVTGYFVL